MNHDMHTTGGVCSFQATDDVDQEKKLLIERGRNVRDELQQLKV